MRLDRVTITGADNSIQPSALVSLADTFPFVEWGILVSKKSAGKTRFPSLDWIERYQQAADKYGMKSSLHICGDYLRKILMGEIPAEITAMLPGFQRVQLNFHGDNVAFDSGRFREALVEMSGEVKREFIFQVDGKNGQYLLTLTTERGFDVPCVPLFDLSHGAGVLPEAWPNPFDEDTYHGYAGGLGPDNLEDEIPKIGVAARGARVWIDMETKVRSMNDQMFDIRLVHRCLEIASRFIEV